MLNTFLRRQGLKIEDLVNLIDFETRLIVFDQLFFQKDYPLQLQINFNKYDNQSREIELLKIPYEGIKLKNYNKDQITKDNKELLDYFKKVNFTTNDLDGEKTIRLNKLKKLKI